MAMNPFAAALMQRIAPQMQRMPQIGQQWSGVQAPAQGMFGQFQPRRANFSGGTMPQLDPAMFMQALQGKFGMPAQTTQAAPQMQGPPRTKADLLANPRNPMSPFTGYIQGQPMNEAQMLTNSGGGLFWNPMWSNNSPGDSGA